MYYIISGEKLQKLSKDTHYSIEYLVSFMKPVRVMTDKEVYNLVESSKNVEGDLMLPFSFAREIEKHILGEEE